MPSVRLFCFDWIGRTLHRSNRFQRNEKEQSNNYCNECFVHDRGGKLMFSLPHPPSTEALERSSRKTLNGDCTSAQAAQLEAGIRQRRGTPSPRVEHLPSRASAYQANA